MSSLSVNHDQRHKHLTPMTQSDELSVGSILGLCRHVQTWPGDKIGSIFLVKTNSQQHCYKDM